MCADQPRNLWPLPGDFMPRHLAAGAPIQSFYADRLRLRKPTISHGDGVYLWDRSGKRYLDGSSGPVVSNLGHNNPYVIQAMQSQAEKVCYAARAWFENEPNVALAGLLAELAGPGFERAFLVSGGSEAIEAALKLARQYAVARGQAARWKVLSRNPSYHGASLGAASVTGDPESESLFHPLMRVMPKIPAPFTYRIPAGFDGPGYAAHCAAALEQAILAEDPGTVLAFLMEPVGGLATGGLVATDAYYDEVRRICSRHGVLLIYDEVMCGAGRTGTFLAADHWPQARPDIAVLGKGIAAGYTPLGVVLAPQHMVDAVVAQGGFLHGHTYSANPLSCAVGYAVLMELLRHDLMPNATARGRQLRAGLQQLAATNPVIGDVRGKGLLLALEIVADQQTKQPFPADAHAIEKFIQIAAAEGLLLYSRRTAGGRFGEWLMIAPPLIISENQVDELLQLLQRSLDIFQQQTFT